MDEVLIKTTSKLDALFSGVKKLFQDMFVRQSVSMPDIYSQVSTALYDENDWSWLIDCFVEPSTGEIFAVVAKEGLLFKTPVTLSDSGVTLGEMQQVKMEFVPVTQNRFMLKRQTDGTTRWFLVASSAVLNRNGAIDSTQLFDNMIKHVKETGTWPFLSFCHFDPLKMGMTDFLERSDYLLMASGTYDSDNAVAQAMQRAYAKDPEYWGASIQFFPTEASMLPITQEVQVPMYTDGEIYEISILPEKIACCLMTALKSRTKVEQRMKKELEDAIKVLAGGDEQLAADFIALADGKNDEIIQQRLIARSTVEPVAAETTSTPSPATETPAAEVTPETPAVEKPAIEVDDAFMTELVTRMASDEKILGIFTPVTQAVEKLSADFAELSSKVIELQAAQQHATTQMVERVKKLEKGDKEKVDEIVNDLPRNQISRRVGYRPRSLPAESETEAKRPAQEIANETLAKFG